jgi:transposase
LLIENVIGEMIEMTYSIQVRKKIMDLHKTGITYEELSKRFVVSVRTLSRWKKELVPKERRNKPWTSINKEALIEDMQKYPDGYCYERAQRLGVSKSGIHDGIKRLGITYKKNPKTSQSRSRKKIYILPKD